ncbi:hypothetical protein FA379_10695 [Pseudomonas aeruginosa]|nr:hypothetical protein [Pseudomonas aeruginosa]MCO2235588.1 hypothetical protein [Pseudomonas aeruginosa]MCO2238851.1 hypothetical protein [Pseudomonas aeruginosa]MCO2336785.1 hypothetical protein [Pseudomonas aeruginosa]MCO2358708.1 hypothetical protein [Pseudomonas aeruginosa]
MGGVFGHVVSSDSLDSLSPFRERGGEREDECDAMPPPWRKRRRVGSGPGVTRPRRLAGPLPSSRPSPCAPRARACRV